MARETRRSGSERFKYGICLNDECPKCKAKEVQQIAMRKEFVCSECGRELRECPPPKKGGNMPIILGAIAVVVLGGGIAGYAVMGGSSDSRETELPDTTVVAITNNADSTAITEIEPTEETTKAEEDNDMKQEPVTAAPVERKVDQPAQPSSGSTNLGYAKFTGSMKSGQPHGQGRMTFCSSHVIDPRDSKGRVADVGDYVIGEWNNGNLVQGRWYGSDGNVKGSIIIGM